MDRHYPAGAAHCLHVDSLDMHGIVQQSRHVSGSCQPGKLPNNLQGMLINMQKWQQNGLTNVLDTHGIIQWRTGLGFVQVREVDKYLNETYCFPVAGMTDEWVEKCFVHTWLCLLTSRSRVRFSSESCQISCRLC